MSGCQKRWTAAVVFLALFVCVIPPLPAGPLPATGVLDALSTPDGSAVSLKAVSVQKTASDPPHIVVSDPWAGVHNVSPTPSEPPAASYRRNNVSPTPSEPPAASYRRNKQLAALVRAADVAPGAFIALATDEPYDTFEPLPFAPMFVRQCLVAAGCRVYVDAASASYAQPPFSGYDSPVDLAVNGYIESLLGTFTFPRLQAAVVGGN